MNKEERYNYLLSEAEKLYEFLETLEARGVLETNKQARLMFERESEKLKKIVVELGELKQEERGNVDMTKEMKMETRTADNFEMELRELVTTANGEAVIPENVANEIVKRMEEVSPAFAQARKLSSVNGELKVPKENDLVTGGFFGEGEEITAEAINFDYVSLKQKRIGAAVNLTKQFTNDSAIDLVAYTNDLLGRRLAKTAEHAIFKGDGVKEFAGIVGATDIEEVPTTGVITIDTLVDVYNKLHSAFLPNAAFYMNRDTFNAIAKLKDGNEHFYLQNGEVNGKLTRTLFGCPVHITEALDANTPIVFGDMTEAYSIMIKKGMQLQNIVADTTQALRGSQLLVLDGYMDGAVTNPAGLVKLVVNAA